MASLLLLLAIVAVFTFFVLCCVGGWRLGGRVIDTMDNVKKIADQNPKR